MRLSCPIVTASFLFGLLFAQEAEAQIPCEEDPVQELPNCSFELGSPPENWIVALGDSFSSSAVSRTGIASATVDARAINGAFAVDIQSDCFELSTMTSFHYGHGGFFSLAGGAVPDCEAVLLVHSDSACSNFVAGLSSFIVTPNSTWLLTARNDLPPAGDSGILALRCNALGDFVIRIDDAFAGPNLPMPVTLQSFSIE